MLLLVRAFACNLEAIGNDVHELDRLVLSDILENWLK